MGLHSRTPSRSLKALTLEKVDDRFDYGETRVYAIGVVNGIETTVIYTDGFGFRAKNHFGLEVGAL